MGGNEGGGGGLDRWNLFGTRSVVHKSPTDPGSETSTGEGFECTIQHLHCSVPFYTITNVFLRLLLTSSTTSLSSRLLAAILLRPAEVLHDGWHKHPDQPQGGRPCQVHAPQD